ncbi:MAG: hypothetical protein ACJAX5_003624 [Patiriisocius sp.]|jgi:hypothetical protein
MNFFKFELAGKGLFAANPHRLVKGAIKVVG